MAWDKDRIERMLDQVANTNGRESAQKSEELLTYVTMSDTSAETGKKAVAYNSEPADTRTYRDK